MWHQLIKSDMHSLCKEIHNQQKKTSGDKVIHGINLPWLYRRIPRTEPWATWLWEQVAHYDHNCFLPRNFCSWKQIIGKNPEGATGDELRLGDGTHKRTPR